MMNRQMFCLLLTCALFFTTSQYGSVVAKEKDRKYYETRGEIVWEVPTDRKVIALTFDDGPDPAYTVQIAELLRQYNARATFFVVGSRVKKYPSVVRQLVLDQHELANHTFTHPDLRRISPEKLRAEVDSAQEAIYSATGVKTKLFRPPGGYYNESLVRVAKESGFQVIMWSWHQDTRDWSDPGVPKIVSKVLNNAHNGDIVLFHDFGGNRQQTVDALRQILPELKKRGYQFVTVSELMQDQHKKVGK
ncbi:polysaccharide deacetylase family protein [Brevibacillus sp. TJ4]|uniref:polysaccharide deacetylase family protein n=1 Tax=Brevibacillus sp. TJ4 TaxID=3234853 RepID=UPI003B9E9C37